MLSAENYSLWWPGISWFCSGFFWDTATNFHQSFFGFGFQFRNQYDSDVTTWSPQGRLHQVRVSDLFCLLLGVWFKENLIPKDFEKSRAETKMPYLIFIFRLSMQWRQSNRDQQLSGKQKVFFAGLFCVKYSTTRSTLEQNPPKMDQDSQKIFIAY